MAEILNLEEQFAILGEAEPSSPQSVLKQGDTFAVFDPQGNITPGPSSLTGSTMPGRDFCLGSSCSSGTGRRCCSAPPLVRTTRYSPPI